MTEKVYLVKGIPNKIQTANKIPVDILLFFKYKILIMISYVDLSRIFQKSNYFGDFSHWKCIHK
jgi:hypothetical protein